MLFKKLFFVEYFSTFKKEVKRQYLRNKFILIWEKALFMKVYFLSNYSYVYNSHLAMNHIAKAIRINNLTNSIKFSKFVCFIFAD